MIQTDSTLDGVGLVIFDEFHERGLHADLALALSLQIRQVLRNDLRLLIMSATIDERCQKHTGISAPDVQRADAFRSIDFVGRK